MKSVPFDANIVIQRNLIGQFTRTFNIISGHGLKLDLCMCKL